jgi:KDO2-lipid IV(A) lauroyltransferase
MDSKKISYIIRLISGFPLPMARVMGSLLGLLMYLIPNRETRIARLNIEICFPELDVAGQRMLLRKSMQENAKLVLEIPSVLNGNPDVWVNRVELGDGQELLEEALNSGRGVIAAGPHLGNWEVGSHYLSTLAPLTCLYKPHDKSTIDAMLTSGRLSGGVNLAPASNKGVRTLLAALRNKEMVALLCDQEPRSEKSDSGVWVPFFGQLAQTMLLVSRLARKTDAVVLFWYMERLKGFAGYRINWLPAPDGIYDADPNVSASALNKGIEACIRRCPEQYVWSYKRFMHRPDGSKFRYREGSMDVSSLE